MAVDDADEATPCGQGLLHKAVDLAVHVITGPADEVDLGVQVLDFGPDPHLARGPGRDFPGPDGLQLTQAALQTPPLGGLQGGPVPLED